MKSHFYFLSLLLLFCASCHKAGTGGKASIKGLVKHHTKPIPYTTVYIKYGAKESPGTSASDYDASVNADANANYQFNNLRKGDYYLYGIGYDSAIALPVKGGIPVQIKKATETVSADVPVTE